MKIISWAIIFVVVIFSFSFINRTILNDKMEIMKEEVKYNNVLDLAVADATAELKTQMNNIADSGYNETQEMMLTVAKSFFDSFSLGFGYYGGNSKESLVKMYVPALTMMTHDGFYMYTLDYVKDGSSTYIEHTLKPETKYMYNDGIQNINFTLDNTVILGEEVTVPDYSNPVMLEVYDEEGNLIDIRQAIDSEGNLVYETKFINTGKVVDLNHWYDITKRTGTWEEQIGNYIYEFKKDGEVCYTSNKRYKDIGSATWNHTNADEDAIVYEKSFFMENGIRYLLEEWRKESTGELLEQRMTEYTDEQLRFTQSIEAYIDDDYGTTTVSNVSGYLVWNDGNFVEKNAGYITYLTRGNPENEGFINLLSGEYEIGEFNKVRREQITKQIKNSLEYYILLHNKFAQNSGITYTFTMPEVEDTDWENAITDMSVFAFVQGIPMVSGKYYNNYGVAGAKVIEQEKFYGIPPENDQIDGKLPTYYSSYEIGSSKTYAFERNNARVYYDTKKAADYGYYPNINGSMAEVEAVERKVWDMKIIKDEFNCVKGGDIVTIPIILSDTIVPSEIKWDIGERSRYYFSSGGKTLNSGTKDIYYHNGRIVDEEINTTILNGSNITWQYAKKGSERVILIVLNAGMVPAGESSITYTIFVRDIEGNSNVETVTLNVIDSNLMGISQTSSKTDTDDNEDNNYISGIFANRQWSNLYKDTNGDYMAYWMTGKVDASVINGYYTNLRSGTNVPGVNKLDYTGANSWQFKAPSYGSYTVFAWDCTGAVVAADVCILPSLQVTYRIDAYKGSNLVQTIEYDSQGNILSGSTEIESEVTKGIVTVNINRTLEQLKYVEYKKGNFDVTADVTNGIDRYIPETGTDIKSSYTFEISENNYYTVYVEDTVDTKECVQINFELITSEFIPDFTSWIIPDINYQKDKKNETSNNWKSYYNPPINIIDSETMSFGSYYYEANNDIIFSPADPKYEIVFKFTINDTNVSYHSSKGAGFLFDLTVNNDGTRSDGYIDYNMSTGGYLLLYEKSNINLYYLGNSNLTTVRTGSLTLTPVATATKLSGGIHETRLEIRQINDTQQTLILKEKNSSGDWQDILSTTIAHNKSTENAYGVIMMHNSHACDERSKFQFDNMSIIQKDYTH